MKLKKVQMSDLLEVVVCDHCMYGIIDDNWNHIDDSKDDGENSARIASNLERFGYMEFLDKANIDGYFECDVCWGIQCGGGYVFTAERD